MAGFSSLKVLWTEITCFYLSAVGEGVVEKNEFPAVVSLRSSVCLTGTQLDFLLLS